MFDYADRSVQLSLQVFGILDPATHAVQDVVTAVGHERRSLRCRSSFQAGDKAPQPPRGCAPTERHDFYCHWTLDAETVHQLGFVDDNDQLFAGAGDNLFAQKRAAATFEKRERADLDLVSAVDCDVNVVVLA